LFYKILVQITSTKEVEEELSESALSLTGDGINLFFNNDILSAYEKAELEEEIKSLKYENQLLKQDLLAVKDTEQSGRNADNNINVAVHDKQTAETGETDYTVISRVSFRWLLVGLNVFTVLRK